MSCQWEKAAWLGICVAAVRPTKGLSIYLRFEAKENVSVNLRVRNVKFDPKFQTQHESGSGLQRGCHVSLVGRCLIHCTGRETVSFATHNYAKNIGYWNSLYILLYLLYGSCASCINCTLSSLIRETETEREDAVDAAAWVDVDAPDRYYLSVYSYRCNPPVSRGLG